MIENRTISSQNRQLQFLEGTSGRLRLLGLIQDRLLNGQTF